MAQTCKSLTDINLSNLSHITNAALCSIAQHLPGLTCLQIERCVKVSNVGVITLARTTSQLLSLDLRHLLITNIAMQTIGTHCRKLRDLNVSYCALLTDDAFTTLNVACLHILHVSETPVTGTFVTHLLGGASALKALFCFCSEHLNSEFVHSLTCNTKVYHLAIASNQLAESEWIALSRKFPKLLNLIIHDSNAVTDAVVLSFRQHCPNLSYVSLHGCSGSSAE